ncbi:unnamed protein product [Mytilus coruscus]|uniref:LRRNT domain-containing protein n=1 Tax=Mytilus coruscus TaxID=42192 RepID=A0A6J8D2E5_MYTCO|nr:unnamed protein product [Mytilus coruscus]
MPCSKTSKGYATVDCSWKNISRIPHLAESTVFLNVSHNLIDSIGKELLKAANHLSTLNLSFYRLSTINFTTFTGKLRYLSLDNNELVYSSQTFPIGIFQPLKSLSHLSLKNNNNRSSCCESFPDETILDLFDLATLELDAGDRGFGKRIRKAIETEILGIRDQFNIFNVKNYTQIY